MVASSVYGFAVYGTRTTNMPTTGTASYEGHMGAVEFPSDDAVLTGSAQANMYQGDVGLMILPPYLEFHKLHSDR